MLLFRSGYPFRRFRTRAAVPRATAFPNNRAAETFVEATMSALLFSPFSLGRLELANRIVVPPMCQYSARDGLADDWHLMHYGTLAASGAGLVIVEATAVSPEGRISPWDLGLWSDDAEAALKRMVDGIRKYSSTPLALQLAHAGRKASQHRPWGPGAGTPVPVEKGGWIPVAPSALPYAPSDPTPEALDEAGIARIVEAFAEAARRAARIGFDALEVHAAHGYLLHEFLSPVSNKRTDAYGGSAAGRMRLPLEVFAAVRRAFPGEKPVGLRLSGSDWLPDGWGVDDSTAFVRELRKRGCAYAHVSGGGLSPDQTLRVGPGYQVGMAERIKRESGLPTIAVGLITEPLQAETILVSGQADLVAVGRGMLYNPRWPWHAAAALGATAAAPPQYLRSAPHGAKGLFK